MSIGTKTRLNIDIGFIQFISNNGNNVYFSNDI